MKKWFTRLGLALALFAGTTTAMAQETLVVDGSKSYFNILQKGTDYRLPGTDESWYAMPGFFTHKEGDVWTFNAYTEMVDYAYAIVLDEKLKYIKVEHLQAGDGQGIEEAQTATYGAAGAVYLNGNGSIGFPTYALNNPNWGGGKDFPVPQIDYGVYQLTLVCGQQIDPTNINFKFFQGKNWGGDMGTTMLYLAENDYIYMGQQGDAGGDNGNLYGKGGDLGDLDTLIVTIDRNNETNGLATVTVEKRAYVPAAYPQVNGENLTKFGNAYYADLALTPGTLLQLSNLDAIDANWDDLYVNEYFAKKGADGKLTFNAVAGNYCVAVIPSLSLIRIYPGTYNEPATYQDDAKAIWIVGNGQIGVPSYATMPSGWGESNGWSPNINHCIPVAQVEPNVYKIEFTVGKELGSDVNFKFFCGVAYKGGEFRGEDLYMEENDYLILKQPESEISYDEQGNETLAYGDEDGNIRNNIAPLGKGDKVILTVDLNGFAFHELDPTTMEVIYHRGKVSVEVIPSEAPKPTLAGVEMLSSGDWYYADVILQKGQKFEIKNLAEVSCDDLYTDKCFASYDGNNSYTFNAIAGQYCAMINTSTNYLKIFPGTHAAPASIADGGLWIIGEGFGRPSVNNNAAGWNTGFEKNFAVAQTSEGIFQMDLMCDTEIWDNWCNFKFFGQPGWGIEFKPYEEYSLVAEEGSILYVNGQTDGDTGDFGNIKFAEGKSFTKGEPAYIVIDFTEGLNAGVLKASASPIIDGIEEVSVNRTNAVYTISGLRVNNAAQHGIYIINGKKIVK